ncbi:ATP-binding protein [Chromobacterium sp. IIBBL 290-4]|uniref:ATP-binding protein n=1 Tax=Chromobacterium sp. IIBBL 290-4 TaxID=2953890 RepID=UPI0020B7ECAC|nr:ATP-binding protein [Chromobacterium sp. IIBBL 290-4]UTH72942.1 ATP-binding protein [Chromobacterium sp. IIBBL 290-4]
MSKFKGGEKLLFGAIWLIATVMVATQWGMAEYRRLRDGFELAAHQVYAGVARRLDQNESVLSAIDALLLSREQFDASALSAFSRDMLPRYQQLYAIEFLRSVTLANRDAFLRDMEARFGETFYIRDFDIKGRRSWLPAPPRSQALVVSMIEPDLPASNPIFGYDMLGDAFFTQDLKRTLATGERVSSRPFELYEGGGKAYLLMQSLRRDALPGKKHAGRPAGFEGVVALVVMCDRLLQLPSDQGLPANLDLSLYPRGEGGQVREVLHEREHHLGDHDWWPLITRLELRLPLNSEAQPFVLGVSRDVRLNDLGLLSLMLRELFVALLVGAAGLIYFQRIALRRERSQAGEELFLQSERASVTLSAIHDGVVILRQDRSIEMANPMALQLVDMPVEEVLGQPCHEVFRLMGELASEFSEDPISECFRTGQSVELAERMQLTTARGKVHFVEGGVAPLMSRDGVLIGVVCALRDMGPLRLRTAAALEASESRVKEHLEKLSHVARLHTMGEMASGIAHELNQPLTAISNYCQAAIQLLDGVEDVPPQVNSALKLAVAQAGRAGEIIKRLRALVSKRSIETRLIDINQVVGNCMFLVEYDLKERGIEVVQLLSGYSIPVMADSIQLEQVVLNLLSNAMDALRDEPAMKRHVIVHTRREGKKGILEVRDTGRGITPDLLEVLFHPFFSTKQHGMGLGLSICQTIVEQYGGLISAENIPASGACFRIELPLALQAERQLG